jgi:hypothetical protein
MKWEVCQQKPLEPTMMLFQDVFPELSQEPTPEVLVALEVPLVTHADADSVHHLTSKQEVAIDSGGKPPPSMLPTVVIAATTALFKGVSSTLA